MRVVNFFKRSALLLVIAPLFLFSNYAHASDIAFRGGDFHGGDFHEGDFHEGDFRGDEMRGDEFRGDQFDRGRDFNRGDVRAYERGYDRGNFNGAYDNEGSPIYVLPEDNVDNMQEGSIIDGSVINGY